MLMGLRISHREGGTAVVKSDGELHRHDGPAIEYPTDIKECYQSDYYIYHQSYPPPSTPIATNTK